MNKKLRFEVFKRDRFICKYCGKKPGETILEVDHIIPRSKGGTDEIENLLTSCFDCNRGKGKRMLNELTAEMQKNAELLKEKKEQLEAFYKYQKDIGKIIDKPVSILSEYWSELTNDEYSLSAKGKISLKYFLKTFSIQEIKEAMDISTKIDDIESRFKYFCGIMHNKKLEKDDPELFDLVKYWKSKKRNDNDYKKEGLTILLKGKEEWGHYPNDLETCKEIIDVIFSKSRGSYYGTLVDYINGEKDITREVSEFSENKEAEKQKEEFDKLQEKNQKRNPDLFKALNYYALLLDDYFFPCVFKKEINILINKHGIEEVLKMFDFSFFQGDLYMEAVIGKLAYDEEEVANKYSEWLNSDFKKYVELREEAREITENQDIDFLNKTLLLLLKKYSLDESKGMLWYVASAIGDLTPENFSDTETLYKGYLEEEKSTKEFFEEQEAKKGKQT